MTREQMLLDRFARRLEGEPGFLSHLLRIYMEQEQVDEGQLALQLHVDAAAFTRLALCRAPRPEPEHFGVDLQRIVDLTGVDATELTRVIRATAAVAALQQIPAPQPDLKPNATSHPVLPSGFLAAARDRELDQGESSEEPTTPPTHDEET